MKKKFICLAIDFYTMGKDVVDEVYFNEDPGSWNSYEDLSEIKSPDYRYSKTDARKNPSEVLVRIGDKKDKKKLENGWESALTSAYQKFIKYLYERRLPKTEFYVEGQMMYVSTWMRTYFKLKYDIRSVEVGTGVYGDLETDKRLFEEDIELSLTEKDKLNLIKGNSAYTNSERDVKKWETDFSYFITNLQLKERHKKPLTSDEKNLLELVELLGTTSVMYDYPDHPRNR